MPLLNESLKMLRATLPKTIRIKEQFGISQAQVKGNWTQIQQGIVHLCVNAGHAMEESGGTLIVSLQNVAHPERAPADLIPGKEYLCLRIQDNGKGMPPEVLSRIFEPFFTTKEQDKGTGLGLSVIDGIIDMHRGRVHVESEVGKGTIFDVYLPRAEAGKTEEITAEIPESQTAPAAEMKALRILLVDDEEDVLRSQVRIFKKLGHSTELCFRGDEAFEKLKESREKFDLMITDQMMPGLTGMQLSSKCRKLWPELPIILATGYSREELPERIENVGISALLLKPYSRSDLSQLLQEVILCNLPVIACHLPSRVGACTRPPTATGTSPCGK